MRFYIVPFGIISMFYLFLIVTHIRFLDLIFVVDQLVDIFEMENLALTSSPVVITIHRIHI